MKRVLVLGVVLFAALAGVAWAAFSATTSTIAGSVDTGSVVISDDDGGQAFFTTSAMQPGDVASGCLRVTYTGSLPAQVRIWGTVSGALVPYTVITITRGTGACASFTPDATAWISRGPGVVSYGRLNGSITDSWANGIVDPSASSPATWTNGETHTYRVELRLLNASGLSGKTAAFTFNWEARNT